MGKPNKMLKQTRLAKTFFVTSILFFVNDPLHGNVSMLLCETVQNATEDVSTVCFEAFASFSFILSKRPSRDTADSYTVSAIIVRTRIESSTVFTAEITGLL